MTQVNIRSREQILGDLVRSTLINTDITAFAPGSDVAILFEALSQALSEVELNSLKILENINLDSLVGNALDKRAESIKLPNGQGGFGRKPALRASGTVLIGSPFEKISSRLYAGKPAPFAGATTIFLNDAANFPATGFVYVGRGTVDRFEGPLEYSSITNNGSFWTVQLTQPLTKSHLQSDEVTFAQGGDRIVGAGTTVLVPANSEAPAVAYTTTRAVTIPDGEAEVTVAVTCSEFGAKGNALAGSIKTFSSRPFDGATVTNPSSFVNGQSTENGEDLRQRIRNYPATLSRGTRGAILGAIIGAIDPDSGRSITSAVVLEPVEPGDVARVYIDDGTALEPTFGNQASETLLKLASGQERKFRTAQFPIVAASVEGAETAPFSLEPGMTLTVQVDDIIESYSVSVANYLNISAASSYEIVRDLNSQSNILGFRTLDGGNRIVAIDLSGEAEIIRVFPSDFQEVIGFSTAELRPLFLYENSRLLSFKGKTATLTTRPRNGWVVDQNDLQDVRVKVDGVIQKFSITDSDFSEFQSSIETATITEWATVLSRKVAGVKFVAQGQFLVWSTWQSLSSGGSLEILEDKEDGTPALWVGEDKIWQPVDSGGILSDTGSEQDYKFNRFTGEVELISKPEVGSTIEVASRNTRAHIRSFESETGLFTLDPSLTLSNSKLVLGFDGSFEVKDNSTPAGATFTPTIPDAANASNVVRASLNSTLPAAGVKVGDWFYLNPDISVGSPLPAGVEGLYRVIAHGANQTEQDLETNGLLASTSFFTSVNFSVELNSNLIKVTQNNHGLKTGDLITTTRTGNLGGILEAEIEVTDAPIVVLNEDEYVYTSAGTATSSASDFLDSLGNNLITVNHDNHGFNDGSYINTTVASGFGGISDLDLTVSNAPIEFVDLDSYIYRASAAATSVASDQTVNTVTQVADTWFEFEISLETLADWTSLLSSPQDLTTGMFNLFGSSVVPQIVDFGTVSSETVDFIVKTINSSVDSGSAEKLSPRQFDVRSNTFDKSGTCAVLAVIGNAENLFTPEVDEGQQAHIANSDSQETEGAFPVASSIVNKEVAGTGLRTRTYISVGRTITDVVDDTTKPEIQNLPLYHPEYPAGFQNLWITGRASCYSARVYNNQTFAPYTGVMTTERNIAPPGAFDSSQTDDDDLDRYSNLAIRLQDIPINNFDNLVVEMDQNPVDRTVAVSMGKLAKIQEIDTIAGSGKGQVLSFRLKDPEDFNLPFFSTSSVYKDFSFTDFKMLTKSVGLYREDASDRALVLRSVDFGAPHQLRLSVRLPEEPDQADILITHSNDFSDGKPRLTLIASLTSGSLAVDSDLNSGLYKVTSSANGDLFDWRFSAPSLNDTSVYVAGNIINVSGGSAIDGSYYIDSANFLDVSSVSASTSPGSNLITVTVPGHSLETGDLIDVFASAAIGGVSAAALTVNSAPVTVINPNTFTYPANFTALNETNVTADTDGSTSIVTVTLTNHGLVTGDSVNVTTSVAIGGISGGDLSGTFTVTVSGPNTFTYSATGVSSSSVSGTLDALTTPTTDIGTIDNIQGGWVVARAPSSGGLSSGALFSASDFPIQSWSLGGSNLEDLATAINEYLPNSPVATAEAIGTNFIANPITLPTFMVYTQTPAYTGQDTTGALDYHTFECLYAGSAGIWQYDSSDENVNGIKATVQTDDAIFPVSADTVGTDYQPIDEEVFIVPTNSQTIRDWLEFRATSSLHILADVETIDSNQKVQISSKENGSGGAVRVTGVTANSLESFVSGNATDADTSTRMTTLRSAARAYVKDQVVRVTNSIPSEVRRSYRLLPEVSQLTSVNTVDINEYFRPTTALKYVRVNQNTGRLIFLRNGMGPAQSEPLNAGTTIDMTVLGDGLVRVDADADTLSARNGDMMYIQKGTSFPAEAQCELVDSGGVTDGTEPEYLGYPVVEVLNETSLIVIAPNITTNSSTTLGSSTDLVFLPAVWNEKNIKTNHAAGAKFRDFVNGNEAYYLVKRLGQGFVSIFLRNTPEESNDDMRLDELQVSTDDFAVFSDGFDPSNQGTFRIIAHNGRNHMVVYNPGGGKDELIDSNAQENGGTGSRKWGVGPLNDGVNRSLRVLDADTVRIGDKLRISTQTDNAQWFNDVFIGSWTITKIGLSAQDFSASTLPHVPSDGVYDQSFVAPYIDFEIPSAPEAVLDDASNPVDSFLVGNNASAVGFTEGTPFDTFRVVSGHAINPQNSENSDIFLNPQRSTAKMSQTFGTKLTAWNKLSFEERTFLGIDGYKLYDGLVQQAHRIIDGLPQNTTLYPGIKAAGATVEVLTPLIKSISLDLQVRPKDGITLNSLTDVVKSNVASYINDLGVGQPVVLSEVIRVVQSLPGVFSVEILSTLPVAEDDRIVSSDIEKPFILNVTSDITVG